MKKKKPQFRLVEIVGLIVISFAMFCILYLLIQATKTNSVKNNYYAYLSHGMNINFKQGDVIMISRILYEKDNNIRGIVCEECGYMDDCMTNNLNRAHKSDVLKDVDKNDIKSFNVYAISFSDVEDMRKENESVQDAYLRYFAEKCVPSDQIEKLFKGMGGVIINGS